MNLLILSLVKIISFIKFDFLHEDVLNKLVFSANTKGLMVILPINLAAWWIGMSAVYYANLAMYSTVSALNISLGISIFVFHALGNPRVHTFYIVNSEILASIIFGQRPRSDTWSGFDLATVGQP